jgi:hypothetical protein
MPWILALFPILRELGEADIETQFTLESELERQRSPNGPSAAADSANLVHTQQAE